MRHLQNHLATGLTRPAAPHAFSLVELLVVIIIMAVVIAIALPSLSRARGAERSLICQTNLRTIAIGLRLYAMDNSNLLPNPASTATSWEQTIKRYTKVREVFHCPADIELFPAVGASYDWRDTGDPTTTLAGKQLTEQLRQNAVLVFDSLPEWHRKDKINAAWVDGGAHEMDQDQCFQDLASPVNR